LDYLRVYAYNFHMKDYKDKVPDRTDGEGKAGGEGWKKEKRQRVEDDQQSDSPVGAVAVAETPSDDPQTDT
jgi:hypothetical protein